MHILLILSYVFSAWMIVDAYKRGAEHYWFLIIFFPLGEWIYFFLVKIHDFDGSSKPKCASCRYCEKIYENGVICGFNNKSIFMNNTHIGYCTYYKKK